MRWLLNYAKMEFQLDFLAHDDHERHVFVVMNWWHAFSQTANWHRFSFQARQWLEKIISTATFFSQSSVPRYCDRWEFLKYSSEQLRFNYNLSYLKLHRIDFCMIQYRFIEVCRERDRGDLNQSSRVSLCCDHPIFSPGFVLFRVRQKLSIVFTWERTGAVVIRW